VPFLDQLFANVLTLARHLANVLLSPGSDFSVWSLAGALLLAIAVAALRRGPGKRFPRARVWLRAMLPRRIVRSPSVKADIGLFLLNTLAIGTLIGWAVMAAAQVGDAVDGVLTATLGAPGPSALPEPLLRVLATVALFLAYEVAYWLDHYTSHKIPFFWAFHKVHHTAEVLTPLTLFRVHPIDTLKFANVSALIVGAMTGLLAWGFGGAAIEYTVNGANLLLVGFIFTIVHLQHSHAWIALTGAWGKLLLSPAHHQIHHSDDPAHFDRNIGSTLAVWDWLAGTLYVPSAKRERIGFGVGAGIERAHSFTGTLLHPFAEAAASLRPKPAPEPEPDGGLPQSLP
jgi:sterol desaturase/sphingolipid hydroxylase (fatty acid hydroxylase superfamily)